MNDIVQRLRNVRQRIAEAEKRFGRQAGSTELLAVSKTRSAEEIRQAWLAGQKAFGENYLQEALDKRSGLPDTDIEWHFIGRIQSNKTRDIAENFDWVHSLGKLKHARRLSDQRPGDLPPLKVCLQVNISGEDSKGGFDENEVADVLAECASLPGLDVRGLMVIPAPAESLEEQRIPFQRLRELRDRLARPGLPLANLSMGMSDDLEAAIAEGSTIVRVGTAIFGPRDYSR